MRRVSFGLVLLSLVATVPTSVAAQQEAGDRVLTLFGNILAQDGSTTGLVSVGTGKFLTRKLEVGVSTTLVITSTDDGFGGSDISTATFVGLLGRYNLATEGQKTFPFVGAEVGSYLQTDVDPVNYFRPHVGLNSFLSRNVAVNVDGGLMNFFAEGESTSAVDIRFGLKVVF
jgi:hypothetical protein